MAERDPFGRLPDENPLAGMGWVSEDTVEQSSAEPVAASWDGSEALAAEPAPEPAPRERPRAAARGEAVAKSQRDAAQAAGLDPAQVSAMVRRVVRIFRIVVTVAIVVVIGLIALGAIASEDDEPARTEEFAPEEIPALPAPPPPASRERSGAAPAGLAPRSLLTRRNVSRAMGRLATSGLGRLRTLRIAPERIDVQLLTRDGKLRSVQVTPDGRQRTLSLSGAGFGGLPTVRFAAVDPGAPARMARSAAERLKRPVSRVDYVAFVSAGTQAVWTVVMRGGGQFVGDERGRITRRVG